VERAAGRGQSDDERVKEMNRGCPLFPSHTLLLTALFAAHDPSCPFLAHPATRRYFAHALNAAACDLAQGKCTWAGASRQTSWLSFFPVMPRRPPSV